MTDEEVIKFAIQPCPFPFTPSTYHRQQNWWSNKVSRLADEDLQRVFRSCTSRWRRQVILSEAQLRASRDQRLQDNAPDAFGVLLAGRLL